VRRRRLYVTHSKIEEIHNTTNFHDPLLENFHKKTRQCTAVLFLLLFGCESDKWRHCDEPEDHPPPTSRQAQAQNRQGVSTGTWPQRRPTAGAKVHHELLARHSRSSADCSACLIKRLGAQAGERPALMRPEE
jgi:hypothetical protein